MSTQCGDRIALLRDVPADDGDTLVAGQVVWVIGHRGEDPVVASDGAHHLNAIVTTGDYRVVPPLLRRRKS